MKTTRKTVSGIAVALVAAAGLALVPSAAFAATFQSFGSYNCGGNLVQTRLNASNGHTHSQSSGSEERKKYFYNGYQYTSYYTSGFKSISSGYVQTNGSQIVSAGRGCDA